MPENDYEDLFNLSPALLLVIDINIFVVAVTDFFLKVTITERNTILGQNVFDVFLENPNDLKADGEKNMRASFNRVINNKVSDTLSIQKYDIKNPKSKGNKFVSRYWKTSHSTLFDTDKNVKNIIVVVEDITENQELITNIQELKKNLVKFVFKYFSNICVQPLGVKQVYFKQ
ncbi:hypothetical protein ACFX5E_12740 [Flavobacterium sp. LS2P90]|uniref:PAC domain-containing protein n=1 Tax=Flavobacterium xylosi TaxID=3230415 RepID=A0ABW6HY47_9FLAO